MTQDMLRKRIPLTAVRAPLGWLVLSNLVALVNMENESSNRLAGPVNIHVLRPVNIQKHVTRYTRTYKGWLVLSHLLAQPTGLTSEHT